MMDGHNSIRLLIDDGHSLWRIVRYLFTDWTLAVLIIFYGQQKKEELKEIYFVGNDHHL